MPIETSFALISDLNSSYPTGNDYRKDGDNHIRGIKTAVKGTFPNINAAITASDEDLNYITGIAADPFSIFEGGLFPTGIICMWSGLNANIPAGWLLCNGTSGTPDLSDRFILGTILDDKASGGVSHTATSSAGGSHSHGGTTGSTVLTEAQLPAHGHPFSVSTSVQSSVNSDGSTVGGIVITQVAGDVQKAANAAAASTLAGKQIGGTGGGEGHTHTLTTQGNHTHTVDTRGKYYKLAFIMKE